MCGPLFPPPLVVPHVVPEASWSMSHVLTQLEDSLYLIANALMHQDPTIPNYVISNPVPGLLLPPLLVVPPVVRELKLSMSSVVILSLELNRSLNSVTLTPSLILMLHAS